MKKTLFLIIGACVATALICCSTKSGNDSNNSKTSSYQEYNTKSIRYTYKAGSIYEAVNLVTIKGHDYLINQRGGIYHAESCPCKNKK